MVLTKHIKLFIRLILRKPCLDFVNEAFLLKFDIFDLNLNLNISLMYA